MNVGPDERLVRHTSSPDMKSPECVEVTSLTPDGRSVNGAALTSDATSTRATVQDWQGCIAFEEVGE